MARAPVSKTGGWGFESLHSCQLQMTKDRGQRTDDGKLGLKPRFSAIRPPTSVVRSLDHTPARQ